MSQADQLVTAYVHRDSDKEDGVIYSSGQRFGGSSFYIKDNRLKYVYNANKFQYFEAVSDIEIPVGDVKLSYSYEYDDSDNTALATIYINDK